MKDDLFTGIALTNLLGGVNKEVDAPLITSVFRIQTVAEITKWAEKTEDKALYEYLYREVADLLRISNENRVGGLAFFKFLMYNLLFLGKLDEFAVYMKRYGRYSGEPDSRRPTYVPEIGQCM